MIILSLSKIHLQHILISFYHQNNNKRRKRNLYNNYLCRKIKIPRQPFHDIQDLYPKLEWQVKTFFSLSLESVNIVALSIATKNVILICLSAYSLICLFTFLFYTNRLHQEQAFLKRTSITYSKRSIYSWFVQKKYKLFVMH